MTGWHLHGEGDAAYIHRPAERCGITGCRPVVIIDVEDEAAAETLACAYWNADPVSSPWDALSTKVQRHLANYMQAALRSLSQPPRPTEPTGRYAVVVDSEGVEWLRSRDGFWCHTVTGEGLGLSGLSRWRMARWEDIAAPKVLSQGVES